MPSLVSINANIFIEKYECSRSHVFITDDKNLKQPQQQQQQERKQNMNKQCL